MKLAASLTKPWLAPLMRQRGLCRGLLAAFLVLGTGMMLGWRLWFCVFAEVTGLPCPGCGLTRAAMALGRGEWGLSLRLHPFAPLFGLVGVLVGFAAVMPVVWVAAWAEKVEVFERRTKLTAIFLMVLIAFSLLRMGGVWYQPTLSEPSGALLKRVLDVGQTRKPDSPTSQHP